MDKKLESLLRRLRKPDAQTLHDFLRKLSDEMQAQIDKIDEVFCALEDIHELS
jgi:hypothetical protein